MQQPAPTASWRHYVNALIAEEISTFTRYYDAAFQWSPRDTDSGVLFETLVAPQKAIVRTGAELGEKMAALEPRSRAAIVLNGNVNHDLDIEKTLSELRPVLNR